MYRTDRRNICGGGTITLNNSVLHAIKGLHGPYTMRFQAQVESRTTIFLVDTSNAYNFLSTTLVFKLSILVSQQHEL